MLRAHQMGISFLELFDLEVGEVYDMMTESINDHEEYAELASQDDCDNFLK